MIPRSAADSGEKLLGKRAQVEPKPFHVADLQETWADIGNAKRLLDWEPQISLDEGLEKTVRWYLENREWVKDILREQKAKAVEEEDYGRAKEVALQIEAAEKAAKAAAATAGDEEAEAAAETEAAAILSTSVLMEAAVKPVFSSSMQGP